MVATARSAAAGLGLVLMSLVFVSLAPAGGAAAPAAAAAAARFETCSGWKLNKLPEVKRFLKEEVERGTYGNHVSVKYIPGRKPELVSVGDDGGELSREDVSSLNFAQIGALLELKGFPRLAEAAPAPPPTPPRQAHARPKPAARVVTRAGMDAQTAPPPEHHAAEL